MPCHYLTDLLRTREPLPVPMSLSQLKQSVNTMVFEMGPLAS